MGLNLLEALVASSVFLFGAMAVAPLLTEAASAARRADSLLEATTVAQNSLDSLRDAIQRGEPVESYECDQAGFHVVQSVGSLDADFYCLSVAVSEMRGRRNLVELISFVEKP
ncbi:MAG: hypothetical protein AB1714_24115 [Acidobacteriota bacterium]